MAKIPPRAAQAFNQAVAALKAGKLVEADRLCRQALATKRDFFEAHRLLGNIQYSQGHAAAALESYDRALALKPREVEALNNRGATLHLLKRYDDALSSLDRALAARPDHAHALNNRGNTLKALGRIEDALASFDRAIAVRPAFPEALYSRGNALLALQRFDEAIASYDRALAARPEYVEALNNRANALQALGRFEEAHASYDRAIALQPTQFDVQYNQSMLRLRLGDFERGWSQHETRWEGAQLRQVKRNFSQPIWRGEDITGKTILLHAEQGFGDTIQFCRYVPLVVQRGAKVILEVPAPLLTLAATVAKPLHILRQGATLPKFDLHCPLLSLPLAFATRLDTIPREASYLKVPAKAAAEWQGRLGPRRGPRVGVAWSGRPSQINDLNRSMPLRALTPLFNLDASFVSLQREVRPDDEAFLKERGDLVNYGEALKDFSDTAALIAQLDVVISVDTSVAHLAGALGKPLWMLLPFIPDWRWLLDRDTSPWYPTARLFRQDETCSWDSVVARVRAALDDFIQAHPADPAAAIPS